METDVLTDALKERGLSVNEDTDPYGRPKLKVRRPGAHPMLTEHITLRDGVACWCWGDRVSPSPDPEVVAKLIDRIVSTSAVENTL